ncbi:hypothetical protein DL89DRAFT_185338 [Linderina pennispora]|uniref:Uncharacterized protein n=1 Tax=Linderina pennispora TaxID=61395 RepID=A0A1Y1VT60_9FUNG|nr:uncharacterized protein DL89DRAFT_185338 [Linderina pennispora]ORX64480.1 hypothetical protein DL89DRAFT_185338 [Linderina pennispora]
MDGVSHFTFIDAPGSADATNVATGHASKVVEIASSHILYTLTISNAGLSVYSWIARRTDPTVTGTVVGTSMGLAVMKGLDELLLQESPAIFAVHGNLLTSQAMNIAGVSA